MKQLAYLLISCVALATASGCSKDSTTATPAGPKEYQVEYRVTSPNVATVDVLYTNETGGQTSLSRVSVPATYSFKRTMKSLDVTSMLASINGGTATSEITASILLDGKEVKKETSRGASGSVNMVYLIQ